MKEKLLGACLLNELSEPTDAKIVGMTDDDIPIIEAILQEGNALNRNKRYYEMSDLRNQVNCPRTRELVKARTFFGEAGHPITTDIARQNTIDPKCISHNIIDIWTDKNFIMGKVMGTPNDYGKLFTKLVKQGSKMAFSSRGLGVLTQTPKGIKVANCKLITFDWVIYPSHPTAYQTKILTESVNATMGTVKNENGIYVPDHKIIIENAAYDGTKKIINCNPEVLNYIQDESATIRDVISQLNINESASVLSDDGNYLILQESETGNKFKMRLETKITNDILDHFGRL